MWVRTGSVSGGMPGLYLYLAAMLLVWGSVGCAGRPDAGSASTGTLNSNGSVQQADGGGFDTLPNGARSVFFGAAMAAPHRCDAAQAAAAIRTWPQPKLRCAGSRDGIQAARTTPVGAVVPTAATESAVRAAIAAAGEGGTVAFEGGRSYPVCAPLAPLKNQRWTRTGSGEAILRRCDGMTATLTAAVASGASTLPVDDASAFAEGSRLTVVSQGSGGKTAADGSPRGHRVTATSATSLTITPALPRAFAKGDAVISAFALVEISVDNVQISGLVFAGNRSKNPDYPGSETFAAIQVSAAAGVRIEGNALRDGPGDLIILRQCDGCIVRDNRFVNGAGAAIALTKTDRALVHHNHMDTMEGLAGALRWKGDNVLARVTANCIAASTGAALGQLSRGDRGLQLDGNTLLGAAHVLLVPAAIQLEPTATGDVSLDLHVVDNFAIEAGSLTVGVGVGVSVDGQDQQPRAVIASDTRRLIGLRIHGNRWLGGTMEVQACGDVSIADNTLAGLDTLTPTKKAATTHRPPDGDGGGAALITLRGVVDTRLHNNLLVGGERGIWLEQRSSGGSANVTIDQTMLVDQQIVGMTIGDSRRFPGAPSGSAGEAVGLSTITCRDNTIASAFSAGGSSPWAVRLGHGIHLLGNCIEGPSAVLLHGLNGQATSSHTADKSAAEPNPTVVFQNRIRGKKLAIGAMAGGDGLLIRANSIAGNIESVILNAKRSSVSANFINRTTCMPCWPATDFWRQLPSGVAVIDMQETP